MGIKEEKKWDLVIKPESSLLDFKFAELWRYRDLLYMFVRRDFVSFYKQTILGPIWFFIQPIFTAIVYVFLFKRLAALSTDEIPAVPFYISGIVIWSYFSECLNKTSTVLRDNAGIFGKVYFPRLIMPLSIIVSSLIKFGVQLLLLILITLYHYLIEGGPIFSEYIMLFPFLIILMAFQGLGLGMIISSLTTKYRDLAMLLNFGIQLLMFATPIVYPLSSLTNSMKTFVSLNPMTTIVEGVRLGFFGAGTFDLYMLGYTTLVSIAILVLGTIVYNKVERNFVDTV